MTDGGMEILLSLLAARGHDFRDYRRDLLIRRVRERMDALRVVDPDAYAERVARDHDELSALVDALLISTSSFFRDPETFAALERDVVPALRARADGRALRVWVAGVATGEEAWSIAMILHRSGAHFEVIASDLSARALEIARCGEYTADRAAAVPPTYRDRYLIDLGARVVIADVLRPHVVFSQHDLLGLAIAPAEAVIARFDLVLCRNVLIYLNDRLQIQLIGRLASVLEPGGILGLGPYESIGADAQRDLEPLPGLPPHLNLFTRRAS